MTQNDNIQTDTPTESANSEQYTSLEEAVFGEGYKESGSDTISDIFNNTGNEGNAEQAPAEGQPQVSEGVKTEEANPAVDDNDTKR
jgi:hypothetical protein